MKKDGTSGLYTSALPLLLLFYFFLFLPFLPFTPWMMLLALKFCLPRHCHLLQLTYLPPLFKKTAEMLVTAFKTAVVRRQVESYLVLHSHLSPATTLAISHQLADLYGAGAFDQLRDNPYR